MLPSTDKKLQFFKVMGAVFAVFLVTYYLVHFVQNRYHIVLPVRHFSSSHKMSAYKFERKTVKFEPSMKKFNVNYEYFEYNVFPRLEGRNNAIVNDGICVLTDAHRRKIVVISNFVYYREPKLKRKMFTNNRKSTDREVEARISEVLETLRGNLKHPDIHSVHIFVEDPDAIPYLLSMPFEKSEKLVIKFVREATWTVILKYTSECLQGHTVAITNQDNLFGEGWEKLDHDILKKHKLMYALTRHPSRRLCLSTLGQSYCGRTPRNSWGCHDTFVFHMNQKFDDQMLSPLANLTQIKSGIESMLIWIFRNKFGYNVTNPCLVLHVHHEHCIPMRETGRITIRNAPNDSAPFTDSLKPPYAG